MIGLIYILDNYKLEFESNYYQIIYRINKDNKSFNNYKTVFETRLKPFQINNIKLNDNSTIVDIKEKKGWTNFYFNIIAMMMIIINIFSYIWLIVEIYDFDEKLKKKKDKQKSIRIKNLIKKRKQYLEFKVR